MPSPEIFKPTGGKYPLVIVQAQYFAGTTKNPAAINGAAGLERKISLGRCKKRR